MSEEQVLSPEQIRALQLKSLEMFNYLWDFCKQHELTIYFCGGCCIGALRHGGSFLVQWMSSSRPITRSWLDSGRYMPILNVTSMFVLLVIWSLAI